MDEIMDQLNQVIEERVLELKRKSEEDKVPAYCRDQGTCPPHGSNSQ